MPLRFLPRFLDSIFRLPSLPTASLSRSPVARHHTQLIKEFQMCPFRTYIILSACTLPGVQGRGEGGLREAGTQGDTAPGRPRKLFLVANLFFPLGLAQSASKQDLEAALARPPGCCCLCGGSRNHVFLILFTPHKETLVGTGKPLAPHHAGCWVRSFAGCVWMWYFSDTWRA